ncbi:alpha-D-ribose 1-methylphosphonate 5-triphosphate diphosphatase [Desulfomicrobium macestii]|uniref:Alpha-D-ribose 1-methylphosphonate 5-triphosphate diphosphatase n=2 Tax=Desulfomicrobium TaxID=898 RepID=A0A8G2F8H0_DESNO|nr:MULTISPECIES: alpha-D-ribose 1-methylphosphonate 5-triphosphate diphosphatase [Desulfomicrobium]MBE1425025.1 alpha-D-ribose 1-methylphosphonate 5-triphosphate diphosphatase [Desulfomicrobium macestii]SFM03560.1 alpha-D-ribose 1-methylphosphonate 5-triphosphate diphosphatase [Desulfomicrobium norvegicum]
MHELILANARIVLADEVILGSLSVRDGLIHDIAPGATTTPAAVDFAGDLLIPGLVELHTDNLEKQLLPRPGVLWPSARAALLAHDAQLVAAGITTVLDALSCGQYYEKSDRRTMLDLTLTALQELRPTGHLRADHFLHVRCEISDPEMPRLFEPFRDMDDVHLVSLMDHTPGQRQFVDIDAYRTYYSKDRQWTDQEFAVEMARMQGVQARFAGAHAEDILGWCRSKGVPVASHDDATAEHVDWAHGHGIAISEFPTTMDAARRACELGLLTLMGSPNVVRNGSHSGNVSVRDVAAAGLLGGLSSDYVPASLLHAAWILHSEVGLPLHESMALVTANPARALGLTDRGRIEPGLRADLVRVHIDRDLPIIRRVWRDGERVY